MEVVFCFRFMIPSSLFKFFNNRKVKWFSLGFKKINITIIVFMITVTVKSPGTAVYTVTLNPVLLFKLPAIYCFCNIKHHVSPGLH